MFSFKTPCCQKECGSDTTPKEGMFSYCPKCEEVLRFMGPDLQARIATSEDIDVIPFEALQQMIANTTEIMNHTQEMTEALEKLKPDLLAKALATKSREKGLKLITEEIKKVAPPAGAISEREFYKSIIPEFAMEFEKKAMTVISVGDTFIIPDEDRSALFFAEASLVEVVVKCLHSLVSDKAMKSGLAESLGKMEIEGMEVH